MSANSRNKRRRKTNILDKARWAGYAAAGAATVLCSYEAAHAEIHYFSYESPVHLDGRDGLNPATHPFDLNGDGFKDLVLANLYLDGGQGQAYGYVFSGRSTYTIPVGIAGFTKYNVFYASRLGKSSFVKSFPDGTPRNFGTSAFGPSSNAYSATMAFGSGSGNDQFLAAEKGFVGFKFDKGDGTQYGFVEVEMDGSPLNTFSILGYAYGDVNDSVHVQPLSSVPEPGSLGLLATGGIGLLLWRWKRRRQSDA